ncbi:MAG: DUF368 domain-containing protein [Oscillospiraceae bacterium]|jgi:putative membrane protein|nr:DUF368 domain-containing protein [Oscillospiraceae bacterium]
MKKFAKEILCGIILGVGGILPGISGGVLAISMGLYEPMLSAIGGFFDVSKLKRGFKEYKKDIKKNFMFLLPLVIGGGIGLMIAATVLSAIAATYETQLTVIFTGLILGGLPQLLLQSETNEKGGWIKTIAWKRVFLIALFVAGFATTFLFRLLENVFRPDGTAVALEGMFAVVTGAVAAFATIVPGISSTFLLIYLGMYRPLLEAISRLHVIPLLYTAAGVAVAGIILVKFVGWLFRRFRRESTYVVLGFSIGSIVLVFRSAVFFENWQVNSVMLIAGIALSLLFMKLFGKRVSE